MTKLDADLPLTLKCIFENASSKKDEPDDTKAPPAQDEPPDEVKVAKADWGVMLSGIKRQIPTLLEEIEVPPLIAEAWKKLDQLQEYHDKTRHPPEELNEVSMTEHTISSTYEPAVEVRINGKRLKSLEIDVVVNLKIEALVLEIKNARIMAVEPGAFTASGSVKWQEHVIKELESSPFNLPGRQALGEGVEIPLLDEGG
jgi:hypothetical protein